MVVTEQEAQTASLQTRWRDCRLHQHWAGPSARRLYFLGPVPLTLLRFVCAIALGETCHAEQLGDGSLGCRCRARSRYGIGRMLWKIVRLVVHGYRDRDGVARDCRDGSTVGSGSGTVESRGGWARRMGLDSYCDRQGVSKSWRESQLGSTINAGQSWLKELC